MASVRQTPSGTWQVRYLDPYRRPRGRNFKRKTDALRFARTVDVDVERGSWTNPALGKTRFGEWADEWMRAATHLKPKTRVGYENSLKNHVLPTFAAVPVDTIKRSSAATSLRRPRRPQAIVHGDFIPRLSRVRIDSGLFADVRTPL